MIFVGSLCLWDGLTFFIVGGVVMAVGVSYLCCYCGVKNKEEGEERDEKDAEKQAKKTDKNEKK